METKHFNKAWWALIGFGMLFIALGTYLLANPSRAFLHLITYTGFILLLDGFLLAVLSSFITHRLEKIIISIESTVNFFFALLLCFNPLFTLLILPLVMGGWLISIGLIKVVASLILRKHIREWLFVCSAGITAILFGFLLIYNPTEKATGILTLGGIFWVLMGIFYIIDAIRFKSKSINSGIILL